MATHTQVKRVEVLITSDEAAYRTKHQPCIEERVAQQKEWAREQLEQAKVQQQREAMKFRQAAMKNKLGSLQAESTLEQLDALEEELKAIDEEDQKQLQDEAFRNTKVDYTEQLTQIKERKLTISRNTADSHRPWSKQQCRRAAFWLWAGFGSGSGRKKHEYTEILPWLILGRRETASNLQELLRMNVTHILNMTSDFPNLFDPHFVYHKVPVRDSTEEDIGKHFQGIVSFIQRVKDCQGKIYVHCSAGASRAPTAILAYLVYHCEVTLVDAYQFVTAKRGVVKPNTHFLFQLAMLEVQLFQECSVYYHQDWRFFEFNTFRAENVPSRATLGLYKTTLKLLLPKVVKRDLVAEAEEQKGKRELWE